MQTSTTNMLQTIATITKSNTTSIIIELHTIGYNFTKSVDEQTTEVDEKVAEMLLNSLITATQQQEETKPQQPIEEIQVEVVEQPNEEVVEEDKHYTQLLSLFNIHKVQPNKVKDKLKLRDEILDILIPKAKAGEIKGRMQRGKQKLEEVAQMIANSSDSEQLATDLVTWLDGYVAKREKRYRGNNIDSIVIPPVVEQSQPLEEDKPQLVVDKNETVEHYVENNIIYIPGVKYDIDFIKKNYNSLNITSKMFDELKEIDSKIFFDLEKKIVLTNSQVVAGFTKEQYEFAIKKINEGCKVQLVKGFKHENLGYRSVIYNSMSNVDIEYYLNEADEVVVLGTRSKVNKNSTIKQHDYFKSLGGETIIDNWKRQYDVFSGCEVSVAIALRLAGYPVTLHDKKISKYNIY